MPDLTDIGPTAPDMPPTPRLRRPITPGPSADQPGGGSGRLQRVRRLDKKGKLVTIHLDS
ncbi:MULTISPECIES: hypothetical protein [Streptomyces]|uniref:hypothetical protein n=1 Tax=Streptomyces TaxID=1883 RepID=UPI0003184144|nr:MULTISPECIES: hypothetical protein [Streptomyces]